MTHKNDHNLPFFEVRAPAVQRVPFVFNSPHSGRNYPESLFAASRLTDLQLRRSEDVAVDHLFADIPSLGAPLLVANFPRAWLDVNREPYELDPLLFRERLPAHANCRSARVAGGLGTIPRLVAENQPIYSTPPSLEDGLRRIETVYRPYHERLRRLIAQTAVEFGYCILVDCHSMPSTGSEKELAPRPDIVIGDRYGTSCNNTISTRLIERFQDFGYATTRNKPYAGGFITEHYGRPLRGLHAVQIEINRALYMDEETLEMHEGMKDLQDAITRISSDIMALPDEAFLPEAEAAE